MIQIYKATNKENNKVYVGLSKDMQGRRIEHLNDAKRGSTTHFHNAIRKYGIDVFEWEVIVECHSREEAGKIEMQMITKHDTYQNGYNSTTGGEFDFEISKEAREKMSAAKIGKEPWNKGLVGISEETRRKLSESHKTQVPWHRGKTGVYSAETRKAMGHMKGKQWTQARREAQKNVRKQTIVECPACLKTGGVGNMKRWHFDNCKHRNT